MPESRSRRRWRFAKTVVCAAGLSLVAAVPAQDNYLDMLDAYSDDIGDSATGGAAADNSRSQFEAQLRRNFKGSYVLYTKLPDESKEVTYNRYLETGRVADVRSLIVKLYAARKQ